MPVIQSCCCWHSLRRGCYAAGVYTLIYFAVTIITMGHFIDEESRYLSGEMEDPESESFLEPNTISETTVSLNITLLVTSSLGLIACCLMMYGVYKDIKCLLLPWLVSMTLETLVEILNFAFLFYLQTLDFNPITSFLFTLDFFVIILNIYGMVCVVSQYQEYCAGRGTASHDYSDRLASVQYVATAQHTMTTSSVPSGRRRSTIAKPMPSRCDPEEFSEVPTKTITSVLSKPTKSAVKKHVQFPDEQSCIEEAAEPLATEEDEKPETGAISSLWMELESEVPVPER